MNTEAPHATPVVCVYVLWQAHPEDPEWAASTSAYRRHSHGYYEHEGQGGGYYGGRPPSHYARYGGDGGRYGREHRYGGDTYYPRGYDEYEGPDHSECCCTGAELPPVHWQ